MYFLIKMKLCIPVCVSFNCEIPEQFNHDPYVLIGCGGFKSNKMAFTDDIGQNISQYNEYVNEMSLTYWISKNYNIIGDPEYIGLAHYRRRLEYEDWMLQPNNIICECENYKMNIYQNYCCCHVKADFDFILNKVHSTFPESLFKSFISFCNQSLNFGRNLFIMNKNKFMQYSGFINQFINMMIYEYFPSSDISRRDKYQKRAFAFLLERLTGFWIYDQMMSNSATVSVVPMKTFDINSPYQRP